MNAKQVKAMLPVIEAFANGIPIQHRPLCEGNLLASGEWMDINPDTTEFRLYDSINPDEWRVKP